MTRRRNAFRIRGALAVISMVIIASAVGCSSSPAPNAATEPAAGTTNDPNGTTSPSTAQGVVAHPGPAPMFSGDGDFYTTPAPLPPGAPGELIRAQLMTPKGFEWAVVLRVMYHSRDPAGRDVAATGVIAYPTGAAPAEGWPTLSYDHGTLGMGPSCAPSRSNKGISAFGVKGVLVASDYIGLGPTGERHPYLSGTSEGHSVIDIVRAARNLADAHAGTTWVTVGISQGGQASLFAGELSAAYAPELHLAGIVAAAPASGLDRVFPEDKALVTSVALAMALFGYVADHPELHLEDYESPELIAASSTFTAGCLTEDSNAVAAIPADKQWIADPRTTEPARSILIENNPGRHEIDLPILIVQGNDDVVVVPARTEALVTSLCALGEVVDLRLYDNAGHETFTKDATDEISGWLADRFAGKDAPNICPSRSEDRQGSPSTAP